LDFHLPFGKSAREEVANNRVRRPFYGSSLGRSARNADAEVEPEGLDRRGNRRCVGACAGFAGPALLAQIEGDRGIAPIASNGDFEVGGIEVNVSGDNAEDARMKGWREAQRKGWEKLWEHNHLGSGGAPALDDGTIDSLVSAVVERRKSARTAISRGWA
jgi:hypothetical protein